MDSTAPKLVVVVPTKDRRKLLERSLGSVWAQTYPHFRVVVVDDGSTDGTHEYLSSLQDPRLTVITHERNRGVNASRNDAFRTLAPDEWAVPLDDDDVFLQDALQRVANAVVATPPDIAVLNFNTITHTSSGDIDTGRQFATEEEWYEPTYHAFFTGEGLQTSGDVRSALRSDLFPKYLFSEDVNGFEGEWWLRIGRDGVRVRYMPERIIWIDRSHEGEHLSDVAARRDPGSFVRAHQRIFKAHASFLDAHSDIARARAVVGLKLAVRARNVSAGFRFLTLYLRFLLKGGKGVVRKPEHK